MTVGDAARSLRFDEGEAFRLPSVDAALLPISKVVCCSVNSVRANRPDVESLGVMHSWATIMVGMAPRIKWQF
jgi:hypothetical protein